METYLLIFYLLIFDEMIAMGFFAIINVSLSKILPLDILTSTILGFKPKFLSLEIAWSLVSINIAVIIILPFGLILMKVYLKFHLNLHYYHQ